MDIGGIKLAPAAAVVQAANRVEPTSSGNRAVATELPRSEAVRALPDAAKPRVPTDRDRQYQQVLLEQTLRNFIQKRNVIDPRTREVIFRAVDTRTGVVINQFPVEARLKLREYINQMREAQRQTALPDRNMSKSA